MENLPSFQSHKLLQEVSTFGIGGPARLFTVVSDVTQMCSVLRYCFREKIPFFILGKGSNCLFDDRGFDGLVIQNKISYLSIHDTVVDVGAGYSFSLLGVKTARLGFKGLEFASGIPATVGGAVYMNAGANGAETADALQEVTFVDERGEIHLIAKEKLHFRYRYSPFQEMKGAIVSARFVLVPCTQAKDRQKQIVHYRTKTQPYQEQSAGCIFRNPKGCSAGKMIEEAGLKGKNVGGAEVSDMHANFIINKRGASACDVRNLVKEIVTCVEEKTGVRLEMEVRFISYRCEQ